ncbi:MAG: MazG family protein [Planctomycetes bacterium]|nr:MazG family protein [Planctomycetota bacterium]
MSPSRPLESPQPTGDARTDALRRLLSIVDRLRASDGCPWDLKQTLSSVAPHLVEESHEVLEAVETAPAGDHSHVVEEAGDLLMGVFLLARIAEDERRFDLAHVAQAVSDKLIRRHPHVFGEGLAANAEQALSHWEAVKRAERAEKAADTSALAGSPTALPSLQRAKRLGEKAMSAGFRWDDARGALAKLREELAELEQAFDAAEAAGATEAACHRGRGCHRGGGDLRRRRGAPARRPGARAGRRDPGGGLPGELRVLGPGAGRPAGPAAFRGALSPHGGFARPARVRLQPLRAHGRLGTRQGPGGLRPKGEAGLDGFALQSRIGPWAPAPPAQRAPRTELIHGESGARFPPLQVPRHRRHAAAGSFRRRIRGRRR